MSLAAEAFLWGGALGLFVGCCFGVIIMALCRAAGDNDVDFIEYRTWRD